MRSGHCASSTSRTRSICSRQARANCSRTISFASASNSLVASFMKRQGPILLYRRPVFRQWATLNLSRPHEKFLLEPSRTFLSKQPKLGGGTNRDEPKGTGSAALSEAGRGQADHTGQGGRANGSERAVGAATFAAQEEGRRPGGGASAARPTVEPQAGGADAVASAAVHRAGVPRLRADVNCRVFTERTRSPSGQGNRAEMDDRCRIVEGQTIQGGQGAQLASAQGEPWRTGAVGHQRACLAGRSRAGPNVSGGDDRRCHQHSACPICGDRQHRTEPTSAVELYRTIRTAAGRVHRQSGNVSAHLGAGVEDRRSGAQDRDADRKSVARAGDGMDRGAFSAGQRTSGTLLRNLARPAGQGAAQGQGADYRASQCLSGKRVPAAVEPAFRTTTRQRSGGTPRTGQAGSVQHPERGGSARRVQRLHRAVARGEVADSAHGDSAGPAGEPAAHRATVGWNDGGQNRWPIRPITTLRWNDGAERDFDYAPAGQALPTGAGAEPLDGSFPGERQCRLARVSRAAVQGQRTVRRSERLRRSQPAAARNLITLSRFPKGKAGAGGCPPTPKHAARQHKPLSRIAALGSPHKRAAAPLCIPCERVRARIEATKQQELSTWLKTGTFYLALTGIWNWSLVFRE